MTDFSQLYDEFLALIENEADQAEVRGYLATMGKSEAGSPEYAQAQRQMIRMLKSRAPHVLPAAWREFARLEDGLRPGELDEDADNEFRSEWKSVMEEIGVFNFGDVPAWEDIDAFMAEESEVELVKHYGTKGWPPAPGPDKRGVKPPHAARQSVHGNAVGVRHMVVRLLALPKFRNKHHLLAEALGLDADTPYRDMFTPELTKDPEYRKKLEDIFQKEFAGKLDEALEGTDRAGENFKLSAGRGRGRRADEHQDPGVAEEAVDRGVTALWEADNAEKASDLTDAQKQAQTLFGKLSSYKTTRGVRNLLDKYEKDARNARAKYTRLKDRGGSAEERAAAMQDVVDANDDFLVALSLGRELLRANPELRDAVGGDPNIDSFIQRHLEIASAYSAVARAYVFAAQHDQGRDAGEHERPQGPDEGAGLWSYYGVPVNELDEVWDDLRKEGIPPLGAARADEREERDEVFPGRGEAAPEAPEEPEASEAEPAEAPEAAPEAPAASGLKEALGEKVDPIVTNLELEWVSDEARDKFLDGLVREKKFRDLKDLSDLEQPDLTTAVENKVFNRMGDNKFFKPKGEESKPEVAPDPFKRPKKKPAPKKPRGDQSGVPSVPSSVWPDYGGKRESQPFQDKMAVLDQWRSDMIARVKGDDRAESDLADTWQDLIDQLTEASRGSDKFEAGSKMLDLLEEFVKDNDIPNAERFLAGRRKQFEQKRKNAAKKVKKRLPKNGTRLPKNEMDEEDGPVRLRRRKPNRLGM